MVRVHRYLIAVALATSFVAFPAASFAGVYVGIGLGGGGGGIGISVGFAPPALPVYEQPPCLVADTIWTPGYWAYGPYGYYWVPGTWVEAPQVGYLWTPGYWGYGDGEYAWHGGYWGPHVGFYGGVNYGFGYGGNGYDGGGWHGDHFRYNTAYTNVNRTTIDNVYVNRTVVNNYDGATTDRTSYNGGEYGLRSRPTANEIAERDERHLPATPVQRQHVDTAAQNRNFLDSVNHGRPNTAAVATPLRRDNRPAGFSPAAANARRATAVGLNDSSRNIAEGKTATDPFSRFDRNSPSYTRSNARTSETASRFDGAKSATADPFSRFDRSSPSYARSSAEAHENDASARSDRGPASRSERTYGSERTANDYHSQVSTRSERSYNAAPSRYNSAATYRSHAAPQAQHPSERSQPAGHSEAHPAESNHSHQH